MSAQLAIITVIYQNYDVLKDFIATLDKQTDKNFQLFVADLSPHPKEYPYPQYAHVVTSFNGGYAHGVNVGIKRAIERGFTEFAVVNNDTYFHEDFVKRALSSLEKHPKTVIGAKIYYAPGFEYHKERYGKDEQGRVFWYAGGTIDWKHALTTHRGVDEVDEGQYDRRTRTDFVTGCLMCFDREVIDTVGYWDEDYFLYFEDADYCVRATKKGVPLLYDPTLVLWHKNAQSTHGAGSAIHKKHQEKNRVLFGLRYAPRRTRLHLIKNYFLYLLTKRRAWLKD